MGRILVIDDDRASAKRMKNIIDFNLKDAKATFVSDEASTREALAQEKFDLVLTTQKCREAGWLNDVQRFMIYDIDVSLDKLVRAIKQVLNRS